MSSEKIASVMDLTITQYEQIEALSSCSYSLEQIALYLGVDEKEFLKVYNEKGSKVRYHYDRGYLLVEFEAGKKIAESAKKGNLTSIQQLKKDRYFNKIENLKKRIQLDEEMEGYNNIQQLMSTGKSDKMSEEEQERYFMMDMVRRLNNKYESKQFIINSLITSYKLSRYKAITVYNDAINFFYLDNEIEVDAWGNVYAERLDNAARICFEMNDFDTYRKLIKDAAELRGVGKEKANTIPPELLDRKPTLYVVDPTVTGIQKADRNKLAKWIDELDISKNEKERLHAEGATGKSNMNVLGIDADEAECIEDDEM